MNPPDAPEKLEPTEAPNVMNEQEKAARAAGAAAADQVIRAQASAGVSTDRIEAHGADTASWLFSEAKTTEGRAFAVGGMAVPTVIDIASRGVVGFALADHLRTELGHRRTGQRRRRPRPGPRCDLPRW